MRTLSIRTKRTAALEAHLKKHILERPSHCYECSTSFQSRKYIQRHLSRVVLKSPKGTPPPDPCSLKNKGTSTSKVKAPSIRNDKKQRASREKSAKTISKSLESTVARKKGLGRKAQIENRKCKVCQVLFSQAHNLVRHHRLGRCKGPPLKTTIQTDDGGDSKPSKFKNSTKHQTGQTTKSSAVLTKCSVPLGKPALAARKGAARNTRQVLKSQRTSSALSSVVTVPKIRQDIEIRKKDTKRVAVDEDAVSDLSELSFLSVSEEEKSEKENFEKDQQNHKEPDYSFFLHLGRYVPDS